MHLASRRLEAGHVRQALNSNPIVQLAVLGVAGVLLAVVMFTTVLKGEEAPEGPQQPTAKDLLADPSAAGTAPAAGGATPVTPEPAAPEPAAPEPATPAPTTPPGGSSSSDGLLPGKGLPEDLLVAYARNQAIALLVVQKGGISDKTVKGYVKRLGARDDVEVFKVKAEDIGRYSRITQGVNVSQAPALVVIRPRAKSGDRPVATVSYGFRSARSVEVALEDALYSGGQRETFPG